jgi:hypothetical protein
LISDGRREQHTGGQIVVSAAGAGQQAARQDEVAAAGGQRRLQEKGKRMRRLERGRGAGVGQHRGHPPHVAEGGGALQQRRQVGGIHLQRAVEPWDGGGQPILAPAELSAQHQSGAVAGIGFDRLVGGEQSRPEITDGAAEAGDVEPGEAVLRVGRDRAVERGIAAFWSPS